MFEKCNVYSYVGLYLNDKELEELGISVANGIEIIGFLRDYKNAYSFDENMIHEFPIHQLYSILSSPDGKYRDFCYRIRNGCFILIPAIQVLYGISSGENNLLAYYSTKEERNQKLSKINQYGITSDIIQDMDCVRNMVEDFKKQQKLRKIYNSLSMKI